MKKERKREERKEQIELPLLHGCSGSYKIQEMGSRPELTACSALSTLWFSWALPQRGISGLVATQDLVQKLQGSLWSIASSAPGICGYCGAAIQAQGNRVCLAGHCLTRARFAPFPYTHAPEMFQTSSPSSLPQYNRKMPIWEITSVGSRIKVNRNSGIQENKSSYLHRVLITFTFYYRCIHFFFWMCRHNVLDIS